MVLNSEIGKKEPVTLNLRAEIPQVFMKDTKMLSSHDATIGFESDSDSYDSASASDSSWDDDESLMEIEERIKEFSVVGTSPALAEMVFNTGEFKLHKRNNATSDPLSSSFRSLQEPILTSDSSAASLHSLQGFESAVAAFQIRKSNSDVCIQGLENRDSSVQQEAGDAVKPDDYLRSLLHEQGIIATPVSWDSLDGFFIEMRAENFSAYDNVIANAARKGDVDAFRAHVKAGKTLLCCNKFKESVMHTICRRGHTEILRYALHEAGTPIRVCDEQGRTPLHDAAWTHEPNFDVVKLILKECPDLLFVKDGRGFTPLTYAIKSCWKKWCEFLETNRDLLAPKALR